MLNRGLLMAGALAWTVAGCGAGVESTPAGPPAAIGEAVAVDQIEYTITGVDTRQAVGEAPYFEKKASEGATYVVVSWSIKNASDKPMEFYQQAPMHLISPEGTAFSSDLEATSAYQTAADLDEKMLSDLNPGITTRGADVYEIASDSFDPATWSLRVQGADKLVALQ